jgi:hypothetical protein
MRSTGMTACGFPGGLGCPKSDGRTAGRGGPSVQAGWLSSGQPGYTELGTPAMTPLTSLGKWAPSPVVGP